MKRATCRLFWLLFLCELFSAAVLGQITPSQDAYTNSASPTTNYGAATTIGVANTSTSIQTGYILFDLSSVPSGYSGANVAKATLKLYVNTVSASGSFNVDYISSSWGEKSITYNNSPTLGSAIASNISLASSNVKGYLLVDITSALQAWLNGTETNYGIALVANSPLNASFDSNESTSQSHPPELDVVFSGNGTITGINTNSGSGLTGGGNTGTLNLSLLTNCAANQVLQFVSGAWTCSNAGSGTITGVTAGSGLSGGGKSGTVTLGVKSCSAGQVLEYVSGAWTCTTPANGTVTQVNSGTGLTGGPITGTGTLSVAVPLSLTQSADSTATITATATGGGDAIGVLGSGVAGVLGRHGSGSGDNLAAYPAGVVGDSNYYYGVLGVSSDIVAVLGHGVGTTIGVSGSSDAGDGILGSSTYGYAGYFEGDVGVTGNLSKGGGSFKIDHPLDPANKYLYHSFVESPDMMNIYNGNVTTDVEGDAVVVLPEWFETLNRDFRYQLTVIGQFAQAIVAREIANRQFAIKTDKPNVKVSWQVTGIRQDAWANAHRIPVEQVKPEQERGFYLHPELYGAPEEKSVGWARHPQAMKRWGETRTKVPAPPGRTSPVAQR